MSSIEISKPLTTTNSAGGVSVFHTEFFNASEKEIKYLTFTYVPYNSVGDVVSCTIKKISEARCQLTGPIEPNRKDFIKWENLWYNPTISTAKIKEVKIQYMDDTEETISGEDIVDVENPNSKFYQLREIERKEEEEKNKKAKKKKLIIGGIIAIVAIILVIMMMK